MFPLKRGQRLAQLHEQVGPRGFVCCLELPGGWPHLLKHQGEFDLWVMELLGAFPLAEFCRNGCCLNDLDAWAPHSMARSHLVIHVLDSPVQCCIPILLVHVVITCSALIPQPNTIVLDLGWVLFKNLQITKWVLRRLLIAFEATLGEGTRKGKGMLIWRQESYMKLYEESTNI